MQKKIVVVTTLFIAMSGIGCVSTLGKRDFKRGDATEEQFDKDSAECELMAEVGHTRYTPITSGHHDDKNSAAEGMESMANAMNKMIVETNSYNKIYSACMRSKGYVRRKNGEQEGEEKVASGDKYPEEAVEHLKKSCVDLGMTRSECDCQITRIQRAVPYDEYKRMMASGTAMPTKVVVEAAKCVRDQHSYPKGVVDAYITSCVENGKDYAQCACEIQHWQRVQTYADFVEWGLEGRPVPEEVVEGGIMCLK